MDDLEWLATRTGVSLLGGPFSVFEAPQPAAALVVEPTHVTAAARVADHVIAAVGWPTGRHHSLIKAAEARLAVEAGAGEIWLAPDPDADVTQMLADIVTVAQAVEVPLGVFFCGAESLAAAEAEAVAALVVPAEVPLPTTHLEVVVLGAAPGTDEAVAQLERGAARVFS